VLFDRCYIEWKPPNAITDKLSLTLSVIMSMWSEVDQVRNNRLRFALGMSVGSRLLLSFCKWYLSPEVVTLSGFHCTWINLIIFVISFNWHFVSIYGRAINFY
jgi:hypothetical protein